MFFKNSMVGIFSILPGGHGHGPDWQHSGNIQSSLYFSNSSFRDGQTGFKAKINLIYSLHQMRFSKISPPAFSPLPMGEQQPAAVELFLEISVENCNVEQSSHRHHPLHSTTLNTCRSKIFPPLWHNEMSKPFVFCLTKLWYIGMECSIK